MDFRFRADRPRRWLLIGAVLLVAMAAGGGYALLQRSRTRSGRLLRLRRYWSDTAAHSEWSVEGGSRCDAAPFLLPTDGFIGFVWGDAFRPGRGPHQGVDIFGPSGPDGLGVTPVFAAYDGYLTRLPEWRSAVILRHPQDPLQPDRQIWTYYTHMADRGGRSFVVEAYPAGTEEQFVPAGTLLGYQGNYSGDANNPTGMHLHFSIVLDDGQGRFRNELDIDNTLDPSPYLGIEVNAARLGEAIPICEDESTPAAFHGSASDGITDLIPPSAGGAR